MGQTKYVHATLIKHPSLSFYVNNCRSHRILIDATSRIFREIIVSVLQILYDIKNYVDVDL